MARLAAAENMLYYPTDVEVIEHFVKEHIVLDIGRNYSRAKLDASLNMFDPCAGEGIAVKAFADALSKKERVNFEIWGIELERERAEEAKARLNHVFNGPFEAFQLIDGRPDIVFFNPPYDEVNGKRLEIQWIDQVAKMMSDGDYILMVLPERFFAGGKNHNSFRMSLKRNNLMPLMGAFKFPAPFYDKFKQHIIVCEKEAPYRVTLQKEIPTLGIIGEVDQKVRLYKYAVDKDPMKLIRVENPVESILVDDSSLENVFGRSDEVIPIDPLQEMRDEIIAAVIAGGLFGGIRVGNTVIRGATKVETVEVKNEKDDGARETILTQKMTAFVSEFDMEAGEFHIWDSSQEEFQSKMEEIAKSVVATLKASKPSKFSEDDIKKYFRKFMDVRAPRAMKGKDDSLYPAQIKSAATILKGWEDQKSIFLIGKMGTGKGQRYTDRILTPKGWTTFGELQVGDKVVGVDGKPTEITGLYPQGKRQFYRVTFSDGSWVDVTDNHLWEVQHTNDRFLGKPARIMETTELIRIGVKQSYNNRKWHIPMVSPVQFEKQNIPLDPYLVGALIGDGGLSTRTVIFTNDDQEIRQRIASALPKGYNLRHISGYDFGIRSSGGRNAVRQALADLGLAGCHSNDKFIPNIYLYNSVEVRVALLQGLLDTDGSVDSRKGTSIEYTSVSEVLIHDVKELVESLGGLAVLSWKVPKYKYNGEQKDGQKAYRLHIALPPEIQPFFTSRKLSKYHPRTKYPITRAIESIEPIGIEEAICIKVSHPRELYVTKDYIVTHNTITSIAAAVGQVRNRKADAQKILILLPAKDDLVSKWKKEIETSCKGLNPKIFIVETITEAEEAFQYKGLCFILIKESMVKRTSGVELVRKKKRCFKCGEVNELVALSGEVSEREAENQYCSSCGISYKTYIRNNKGKAYASVANYILKRYAKSFVLIMDEAHQFKGGDSARGYASGSLMKAAWRVLVMTGTLYNGYASSIFFLLHRGNGEFRATYGYDDVSDYVSFYGLEQKIITEKKKDSSYSWSGYNVKKTVRVKEIPGIHPSMIATMLPFTVFMKLEDFNIALPDKSESTVFFDLPTDVFDHVQNYLEEIKAKAVDQMKDGNMSLLSQLTWAKAAVHDIYPLGDSVADDEFSFSLDPIHPDKITSKEQAILRIVAGEKARERPVLIYYIQSERRPIWQRLEMQFKHHGMKLVFMGSNVKNRVAFIEKALDEGADAIICNPGLVREGIDLLQFKTIVWYGVTSDAILVNQANARIYRIGQDEPTKIYYLGYNQTYQADRWLVTAKKVAAMAAAHGDVTSGLAALLGEENMITTVQNAIIDYPRHDSDMSIDDLPELRVFTEKDAKPVTEKPAPIMSDFETLMDEWKKKNPIPVKIPRRTSQDVKTGQTTLF